MSAPGSTTGWSQAVCEGRPLEVWDRFFGGHLLQVFRCAETGGWVRCVDNAYAGPCANPDVGMQLLDRQVA